MSPLDFLFHEQNCQIICLYLYTFTKYLKYVHKYVTNHSRNAHTYQLYFYLKIRITHTFLFHMLRTLSTPSFKIYKKEAADAVSFYFLTLYKYKVTIVYFIAILPTPTSYSPHPLSAAPTHPRAPHNTSDKSSP